MKNIKISVIADTYEELMCWLVEADYNEWITSEGMFFEVKNNQLSGAIDIIMVEHHNVRYIVNNNTLYLFDEEYCYSVDEDYSKKLIKFGYHLNN